MAYGKSVQNWPAFEDSAEALQYLKQHYKLVILSNIDNESFTYSNAKLQVEFDAIITAEDVGSYKPSPRNFEYMLDKLGERGIKKDKILHTAESLFHDHKPANECGLASCWIYRRHEQEGFGATMNPGQQPKVDFRFNNMAGLAKAHQEALLQEVTFLYRARRPGDSNSQDVARQVAGRALKCDLFSRRFKCDSLISGRSHSIVTAR